MKIIDSTEREEGFKPFQFTMEVETEDDLRNLYHRFHGGHKRLREFSDSALLDLPDEDSTYIVWSFIKREAEKAGLIK